MRRQRGQIFVSHRAALTPGRVLVIAALVLVACASPPASPPTEPPPIAREPEHGPEQVFADAPDPVFDASDAGAGDAGTGDAGAGDAGTGDAGTGDAGTGDAGAGDAGAGDAGDLIDVRDLDRTIVLDMRYATTDNFTGVAVYPVARCLLRRGVAERLVRVQKSLRARGLGLKLWDCYRPISVQQRFWALVPDARYVARPVIVNGVARQGSRHNRGAAVDVTLVDARGVELVMPTAHDEFGARSHRDSDLHSPIARRNMKLLQRSMGAEGFVPLATEWWHFDAPDWQTYPLSDIPLQRE